MNSFKTTITIAGSVDTIWQVLLDVARWPDWNTTIDKVEGKASLGEKITVYSTANPGRAFALKVTELIPLERMVWTGGMPLGLFTGKRTYTLTPQDDTSIRFSMNEAFSGLLAPLITKSIPDLQPSFDEFASCLKKHVESLNTE